MAEAILVDLASGIVSKLVSLAAEEVIQAWNVHQDLETLRERLELVDALLSDAANKNIPMITVQKWFNKLEAVAHAADVFMDELDYEVTRQKVENHRKVQNFCVPSKNTILCRFKMGRRIKSLLASFDENFKWAADLGIHPVAHLNSIVQTGETVKTLPFEDKSLVVGRGKDISSLVQMLCKEYREDLQVIAIVGMGGQGKTTLARMVYNRDDVNNMFMKRMWITVSYDFDIIKILNEMVESLTSTPSVLTNAEGLIKVLQKNLKGKRFLLVLDNVWNETPKEWESLRNSLLEIGGEKGSNILLTTRSQQVIDVMQCVSYPVEKLAEKDSWKLFKKIAFSNGGVSETEEFVAPGKRMVGRCGGLPQAIKTLGGLLRSKSKEDWLKIENSKIWKSEGVLSSLRLSYNNLPCSSLKRCFAYCALMPKDSVIYKDKLVQIWMALDFLLPPEGSSALMEDIGNDYFSILLWNSLLQDVARDASGKIISCKMHDLVHDLAVDISKHHSITVNADHELNHISGARYMRLNKKVSKRKPEILKRSFERVQLLFAKKASIIGGVLPYCNHLTVLVLRTGKYKDELPRSLRKMKYLKYLDVSCLYNRLPSYIMEFYNLQTLRVHNLKGLEKKLCKLINLRHLYIEDTSDDRECTFTGMERLTCLQTLPHFVVSRNQNCHIGQLGGLNIGGKFKIYGLCDIENKEEARKANLRRKADIQHLLLDWYQKENEREDKDEDKYDDVMEGLEPHLNLKRLEIICFEGKKFASWITMMTNLVEVTFRKCNSCQGFPSLGSLPNLRKMMVIGMDNLKIIGRDCYGDQGNISCEFSESGGAGLITTMYPSLTNLILRDLPKLEEWLEQIMGTGGERQSSVLLFPKLEDMEISNCAELRRISSSFPSLKNLEITNSNNMIIETMRNVNSLRYLQLNKGHASSSSSSPNIDSMFDKLLKNNLSLTNFDISDFPGLTCLTLGVALTTFEVSNCPDLTTVNVVGDSGALKYLTIKKCSALSKFAFSQTRSFTLEKLKLGPFSEDMEEFPWPFISSSTSSAAAAASSSPPPPASPLLSFANLINLELLGWKNVKSIQLFEQIDDRLSSTLPALTHLDIQDFTGLKVLPDSIAKLPSLKTLSISSCRRLESLPMFDESHCLQKLEIVMCRGLKERYNKESGPEWFKIQHIPSIQWNFEGLVEEPLAAGGMALSTFQTAFDFMDEATWSDTEEGRMQEMGEILMKEMKHLFK